jgi:flavin reductase (DIM6/NTAB) family NADH-FMN oxidoreductase RutF
VSDPNFNISEYRRALSSFMTGVTVVTTIDDLGNPRGFTTNSFTSVSLNPPLVLVCIAKAAGSCSVFTDADGYAVNILAEDQRHAATIFASQEVDRFSCVEWSIGPAGNPVFSDAASWVDCSLYNRIDAGDHWILIGQTVGFDSKAKPLLGYGRGSYFTASLEHSASKDIGSRT